jgi:ABC-type Fe3+-hydroxamate transport system substrate-binding protein
MKPSILTQELKWIVPFLCMGAVALATVHTEPQLPPPKGERVVTDIRGKAVSIELPFRGSVLTRGTEVTGYLVGTRAPETLRAATAYAMGERVRNHIIGHIFPEVENNPNIWATDGVSNTNGPKVAIEQMLLFDPGVYMGWYTLAEPFERVGIPFIGFIPIARSMEEMKYSTRTYSRVVGNPQRGEDIVARSDAIYRELAEEFSEKYPVDVAQKPLKRPTYLYVMPRDYLSILGQTNHYTLFLSPPAQVDIACDCPWAFSQIDPELLHLYDPDIIILGPQPKLQRPEEFMRDPRWQGLSAIKNRQVYRAPPGIDFYIAGSFWSRWTAELSHEKLEPKVRLMYWDYIRWLFDYELSSEELDIAFAVADNVGMVNAERFTRQKNDK